MFKVFKKFYEHGIVTIEYPKVPINKGFLTGKPVVDKDKCNLCGECAERCPSSAIVIEKSEENKNSNNNMTSVRFNIDQCLFCSLCADMCPQKAIEMNHEFEFASKDRSSLRGVPVVVEERHIQSSEYELVGKQLKEKVDKLFGGSLQIREVDAGSCNGCDNEINALGSPYNDVERFGIHFVASPRHADMLLVTGPVTRNMELALIKTYNATPDPKLVVAAGACACSGGVFRDSYSTRNGVDCILPVDVYIPGCPPRPQALMYGILKAIDRI